METSLLCGHLMAVAFVSLGITLYFALERLILYFKADCHYYAVFILTKRFEEILKITPVKFTVLLFA